MAYLYRTADFSSSNATSAVLSFWIKKTKNDTLQGLFLGWNNSSNYATCYVNNSDDTIYYKEKNGGTQYETRITSGARKFRDLNAWMHFVFQWDYTQATASNRIKVWINGELQTWENTGNLPPQNYSLRLKSSDFRIGNYTHAGSNYYTWQGLMSHVHFIDDAPYDTYSASTFGSTDSTTGEWKINTSPTISNYGSQGFFILKDDNLGTDRSGKGNNLTTSGSLTKTEDSPSNVFATWNKLDWGTTYFTLTNGSTTAQSNASVYTYGIATLGVNSGKFYWEVEYDAKNGGDKFPQIGITSTQTTNTQYELGHYANDWCYYISDTTANLRNNNSNTNWGTEYVEGDIIGVALDCTNNKLYFSKNGTWQESGDPSAGNNGISITAPSSTPLGFYFPAICYYDGTHRGTFKANFGNGYFGTTAVASAGTNASGIGIFEYDVPTGYTALSTKGLNL